MKRKNLFGVGFLESNNPLASICTTRICICGGRKFDDIPFFVWWMSTQLCHAINMDLKTIMEMATVVTGKADGADFLGEAWAELHGIPVDPFPAKWYEFGYLDRSAGRKRNKRMLDSGLQYCIAFKGGSGTAHMMRICREAGVTTIDTEDYRKDYHF